MSDYMICIVAKTGTTVIGRLTARVLVYMQKVNFNVANVMPENNDNYGIQCARHAALDLLTCLY